VTVLRRLLTIVHAAGTLKYPFTKPRPPSRRSTLPIASVAASERRGVHARHRTIRNWRDRRLIINSVSIPYTFMLPAAKHTHPSPRKLLGQIDLRLATGVLLLAPAVWFTWLTIDTLASRRSLRMELAEISHVRYGLLNANRWKEIILPILDARIDTLDLRSPNQASLRPIVENGLYRLLDDVKQKMSAKNSQTPAAAGFPGPGSPLIANMMIGALRPHVPEYAGVVLAELGRPENKLAFKKYIRSLIAEGAARTFGNVDMKLYSSILRKHGCKEAIACQEKLGNRIRMLDASIAADYLLALGATAVAFALVMIARPVLRRSSVVLLSLFCVILLAGGVLTPMVEVEATITRAGFTFLGDPIAFHDQSLYFQSKSVIEVFRTLITMGRPEMWFVGVLVLMFSVVFPVLKLLTLGICLHKPALLRNRVVKFLALDSSKWSMADVMALAIFMTFVAFNGLIGSAMNRLNETGADLLIPTNSSKILPGYYLFIGFCLASLVLSKKLERGIKTGQDAEPD
jgi:Paraquat-inducible protein A